MNLSLEERVTAHMDKKKNKYSNYNVIKNYKPVSIIEEIIINVIQVIISSIAIILLSLIHI